MFKKIFKLSWTKAIITVVLAVVFYLGSNGLVKGLDATTLNVAKILAELTVLYIIAMLIATLAWEMSRKKKSKRKR